MQKLKRLEWTDVGVLVGIACALAGLYQLAGEAWTLLIFGLLLFALSALFDIRAVR